jgi:hypothetical protein
MDFEKKYYKYKEKYLELKKMKAAGYIYPRGPMIGYPAVPFMSPQVRVTGPIPQIYPGVRAISPFRPILPSPLLFGPRLVRVTETESPKCPSPASHKIYLTVSLDELKKQIFDKIETKFKFIVVDSCDVRYTEKILEDLRGLKTIKVSSSKLSDKQIEIEFHIENINNVLKNLKIPDISSPLKQKYDFSIDLKSFISKSDIDISISFEKA